MEPQIISPQQSPSELPKDQEVSISVDHRPAASMAPPTPTTPQVSQPIVAPPEPTPAPIAVSTASATPWQFNNNAAPDPLPAHHSDDTISWSASEFIAYQKSAGWYVQILLAVAVVAGLVYFLTRDLISTIAVIFIGILFVVFAGRKPRVLTYGIDESGVHIGDKLYAFNTLRSFAVIDEGHLHSITLLPLQRFMPSISMYYEPQDEGRIVEILGGYLPEEDRKQDPVDRFMHKIRF